MFNRNSGSNEHDILQNQFTSYLSFAVSNARIDFIRAKIARLKREQVTDQYELIFAQDSFEIEALLATKISRSVNLDKAFFNASSMKDL